MKKRFLLSSAPLIAMVMIITACGGGNTAGNNTANGGNTTTANAVEKVYKANCIQCHGADLKGMNLITVGSRRSQEDIVNKITNGGGGMPAFKERLSADEIDSLAAWLVEKK